MKNKLILLVFLLSTSIFAGVRFINNGNYGLSEPTKVTTGTLDLSPPVTAVGYQTLKYGHADRNGTNYTTTTTAFEDVPVTRIVTQDGGETGFDLSGPNDFYQGIDTDFRLFISHIFGTSNNRDFRTTIRESDSGLTFIRLLSDLRGIGSTNGEFKTTIAPVNTVVGNYYLTSIDSNNVSYIQIEGDPKEYFFKSVGLKELGSSNGLTFFNGYAIGDVLTNGTPVDILVDNVTDDADSLLAVDGRIDLNKAGFWLFSHHSWHDSSSTHQFQVYDYTNATILSKTTGYREGQHGFYLYESVNGNEEIGLRGNGLGASPVLVRGYLQAIYIGTRAGLPDSDWLWVKASNNTNKGNGINVDMFQDEQTSSGQWTGSTGTYEVPSNGYYIATILCGTEDILNNGSLDAVIRVNAVDTVSQRSWAESTSGTTRGSVAIFDVMKLSSGDDLQFGCGKTDGGGTWGIDRTLDESYIQVMKIGEY